jgi:hypothetical protein
MVQLTEVRLFAPPMKQIGGCSPAESNQVRCASASLPLNDNPLSKFADRRSPLGTAAKKIAREFVDGKPNLQNDVV